MRDDPTVQALSTWLADLPGRGGLPFDAQPQRLYTVGSLYRGYSPADPASLKSTLDARIYDWTVEAAAGAPRCLNMAEFVAARLHDTRIDGEISRFLDAPGCKTVGVMGGHNVPRTAPAFEDIARVARELRRGDFKIVTGGGPGLMEAANFGAFMAPYDEAAFERAVATLRAAPSFLAAGDWVGTAAEVRRRLLGAWDAEAPDESSNLGVPTWVYGAEPPNLFATAIGKYFYNSLREDGLVSIANGGLIFARGEAGTVQEVFQNATLNYYRKAGLAPTPMVFFGMEFWNPDPLGGLLVEPLAKPVYPLIEKLAFDAGQPFEGALMLSDDADAIVEFIVEANAQPPRHGAPGRRRAPDRGRGPEGAGWTATCPVRSATRYIEV